MEDGEYYMKIFSNYFWPIIFFMSAFLLLIVNLLIINNIAYNIITSIACSTISASMIAFYVDYKQKKTIEKAKSVSKEELIKDFKILCSNLCWIYDDLINQTSTELISNKVSSENIYSIITKCQNNHNIKNIGLEELCNVIKKYKSLNLTDAQKIFLEKISVDFISNYTQSILKDILFLEDVFIKIDLSEYVKFKNEFEDQKLFLKVAELFRNPVGKNPQYCTILYLMSNPILKIGEYLKIHNIRVDDKITSLSKII